MLIDDKLARTTDDNPSPLLTTFDPIHGHVWRHRTGPRETGDFEHRLVYTAILQGPIGFPEQPRLDDLTAAAQRHALNGE